MQAIIDKKLNKQIADVSETLGVDRRGFIRRAVLYYLDNVKKASDFRKELNAWDDLSNDALIVMDHAKR